MKTSRLRIIAVLAAIALVAADCGWLRNLFTGRGSVLGLGEGATDDALLDLGVIAMANIMGFALLAARDRRRPFLVGFELAGAGAILAYLGCGWLFSRSFAFDLVEAGIVGIHDTYMRHLPAWASRFDRSKLYPLHVLLPLIIMFAVMLILPLLACALCGGFLWRRAAKHAA